MVARLKQGNALLCFKPAVMLSLFNLISKHKPIKQLPYIREGLLITLY